jgi:hypothetical protein
MVPSTSFSFAQKTAANENSGSNRPGCDICFYPVRNGLAARTMSIGQSGLGKLRLDKSGLGEFLFLADRHGRIFESLNCCFHDDVLNVLSMSLMARCSNANGFPRRYRQEARERHIGRPAFALFLRRGGIERRLEGLATGKVGRRHGAFPLRRKRKLEKREGKAGCA